jgi:hypothetical protein
MRAWRSTFQPQLQLSRTQALLMIRPFGSAVVSQTLRIAGIMAPLKRSEYSCLPDSPNASPPGGHYGTRAHRKTAGGGSNCRTGRQRCLDGYRPGLYPSRTHEIDYSEENFATAATAKRCGQRTPRGDRRRETGRPLIGPSCGGAGTGGLQATNSRISRIRNTH